MCIQKNFLCKNENQNKPNGASRYFTLPNSLCTFNSNNCMALIVTVHQIQTFTTKGKQNFQFIFAIFEHIKIFEQMFIDIRFMPAKSLVCPTTSP